MQRRIIHVHPCVERLGDAIGEALARLTSIQFKSCADPADLRAGDTLLSLSGDDGVLDEISKARLCCFHFTSSIARPRSEDAGATVEFASSTSLDKLLRGRRIPHRAMPKLPAVRVESGDEVLALFDGEPVWVLRRTTGLAVHIASAPWPQLAAGEQPFDYLNAYHFIQLLPLLHFLRDVTADSGWVRPPLQACLMFDDPNLHWSSYGFLSYAELIRRAREENFHVTFATVPRDAWRPHSRTVNLFKENREYVSLLVHGNDHTRNEFGQKRTRDGHLRVVAQSLQRIENLESISGLRVDRVLVPPHEALADDVLMPMLFLGFEGVSLSPWSLRNWNPKREWPSTFGLETAEVMEGGFPSLARYYWSGPCEGPAVISAFLGGPIVLCEHHGAVADGLELLSSAARVVNSLGEVRWCGTQAILRANYWRRRENATLWVRPYSTRIELQVPEDVRSVALAAPEGTDDLDAGRSSWVLNRPGKETPSTRVQTGERFSAVPGETIELVCPNLGSLDHRGLTMPGFDLWALSRRILCEARDRLLALKPRATRR